MSFDDTGREPEQAFRLNRDPLAQLEYPTKWEHKHWQTFLHLQKNLDKWWLSHLDFITQQTERW